MQLVLNSIPQLGPYVCASPLYRTKPLTATCTSGVVQTGDQELELPDEACLHTLRDSAATRIYTHNLRGSNARSPAIEPAEWGLGGVKGCGYVSSARACRTFRTYTPIRYLPSRALEICTGVIGTASALARAH
jgi:hypothetical protein